MRVRWSEVAVVVGPEVIVTRGIRGHGGVYMRIEVSAKHMELTDAIREYADQKVAKLTRFYDGVQEIEVVFEQQRHGEFIVELRVDSEKHSTFVASQTGQDVYECVDHSIDKMARQLTDFKEKLKNNKR